MSTWFAGLIVVAALTATYFLCVRPMLRNGRHHGVSGGAGQDVEFGRQVAALREELRVLRAQDSLDRPREPNRPPTPCRT